MPNSRLRELFVEQLGVIERAHLEFDPGFVALTGETGAGKTLLVGALELCLGREGTTTRRGVGPGTRVSVVVESDDGELALGRESTDAGRLRALVNSAPTSAEGLRTLGESHIEILGQHDSLRLGHRSEILRLLDEAGGIDSSELDRLSLRHRTLLKSVSEFGTDSAERERLADFLSFQIAEFDEVNPSSPSELRDAMSELEAISSLQSHLTDVLRAVEELDADEGGALGRLGDVARGLGAVPELSTAASRLHEAVNVAREGLYEMRQWADPERVDPSRLAALEARVDTLQRLARKYGGHLETAFSEVAALRERRQALVDGEGEWSRQNAELASLEIDLRVESERLARERALAAEELSSRVNRQLPRVALAGAAVRVLVGGEDGSSVSLDFRPHPSAPWGPVAELASGGELSRILLAISLATVVGNSVAVYDEIDAGIGGSVAQHIGECLAELSVHQQVLAVTHLASIAAKAHQHFVVERLDSGVARVREVRGEERVREIARMLSGEPDDHHAQSLARQLLAAGAPRDEGESGSMGVRGE